MIKVASYDVWGTLFRMDAEYKKVRAQLIAQRLGWSGELGAVVVAIREAYDEYGNQMNVTGEQFRFTSFVESTAGLLGLDTPDQAALVLLEKEVNEAHLAHPPQLTEAWLSEVFGWHKAQGRSVAIVSNTAMTSSYILRELLDAAGLLRYVDYELFSDEVGVAKPNEAIFASLIKRSNAFASEIVHIGNSENADYQGAKSAGLHALLYDRKDRTGNDTVISSHEDVFMHRLLVESRYTVEAR